MKSCVLILLVLISSVLGTPSGTGTGLVLRHKRETESLENTRKLIQDLVANLRNATQSGMASMNNFTKGIEEQMVLFQEQVDNETALLREKVSNAIQEFRKRFQNSGAAVLDCVEKHRADAENLFNETLTKTIACATDRIDDIGGNLIALANATSNAIQDADTALKDARNCTEANADNILAAGACLGGVALRIQLQEANYAIQSGLAISRISIAIATLQSTLEACASSRFLEASLGVAKITLGIGTCSVFSIFTILTTGNSSVL